MRVSVATWNINSVRLRIDLVARFLAERKPHVLCLQETKVRDAEFPLAAFRELGYPHAAIHGQKGYHGVAILSKLKLSEPARRDFCGKGDARHVSAVVSPRTGEPFRLHNLYVPAGGDEPDREANDKFAHKLDFVDEMAAAGRDGGFGRGRRMLVGDLNVAPLEHDVWSHKALLNVVSHTPVEVGKFEAARAAGGWVDALRRFRPDAEKLYTWWSYRSPDWAA
ncbi:MAG: endonuclease/exonuclease/phosphatase family protein, partial [Hyphomicrobiales bacterium]|nr:endonuclease/exonuclease/phosphatase family protein [Hyphomicrobiales bacterium]